LKLCQRAGAQAMRCKALWQEMGASSVVAG
jgi:hypothetical protein